MRAGTGAQTGSANRWGDYSSMSLDTDGCTFWYTQEYQVNDDARTDFDFKTRHAREFLGEGNKVKVTMMYRGRQIAHLELGKAVLDRVAASLADIGKIEMEAKLEGRNMTMVLAPK